MLRNIVLFVLLLISPAFAANPDFVISYWWGPTPKFTTLDRYKEVKNANFTLAFPAGGGMTVEQNKKLLDYCQQVGLKAVISDSRMPRSIGNNPKNKEALDAIVKDYSNHPALFGYFITDEPPAGAFPGLAEVVAYLKQKDPDHPGYINLLPTYAGPMGALGTKTYEDYVRQFVKIVKPFAISYDHYSFKNNGTDRPDFFENLATVRKVALENHIPFWNIVLCTECAGYRRLTEPELRFEAMQTLTYGARGLLWFTYWSPAESDHSTAWAHSMINVDGSRDPHYDMIKNINADVLAIAHQLNDATSVEVQNQKTFMLGTFKSTAGDTLLLAANLNYKKPTDARIPVTTATAEEFDPASQLWHRLEIQSIDNHPQVQLSLPPGGGILVRTR